MKRHPFHLSLLLMPVAEVLAEFTDKAHAPTFPAFFLHLFKATEFEPRPSACFFQSHAAGNIISHEFELPGFCTTAREVNVKGKIKPGTPVMSHEQAAEEYNREYKRRYEEWMAGSLPVGR